LPAQTLDIEASYLRYGPMVLRRCRSLLRHPAKAEDAMQDVFVAVLRAEERTTDRLHGEATGALLLRIATNVCLNRLRSERRRPEDAADALALEIAAADAGAGADALASARQLLARLFHADDPLAASTGSLAVMHLVDGMTLEEVAHESGMSVSGVRKRLRGLRGRLAALVGERDAAESNTRGAAS
jgi:RNA polymerase sigma-70 factor (ECF subfamily)